MQKVLDSLDLTIALKFHDTHGFVILLSHKCALNTPEPTSHCSSSLSTCPDAHSHSYEVKAFYCNLWKKLE